MKFADLLKIISEDSIILIEINWKVAHFDYIYNLKMNYLLDYNVEYIFPTDWNDYECRYYISRYKNVYENIRDKPFLRIGLKNDSLS